MNHLSLTFRLVFPLLGWNTFSIPLISAVSISLALIDASCFYSLLKFLIDLHDLLLALIAKYVSY